MKIDVTVQSDVMRTFRVDQVAGMFDLPVEAKSRERFRVEVPAPGEGEDPDWKIGAIVGPSGKGKSTVARAWVDAVNGQEEPGPSRGSGPACLAEGFEWPGDAAVLDGFDAGLEGKQIGAMLNAVGFSEPPAWVRPYRVLSGGQRFRCDLARALLLERELVAFDEFTSVVDRQVAQVGSVCVAKAVRRGKALCKRFVAVTCHYDVLAPLEPDWILDMATGKLAWPRGSLRREQWELRVHRVRRRGRGGAWALFKAHHYLSSKLARGARCYVASLDGRPVAFCAVIQNAGHLGRRIVHRLVVLPDFQGVGIGTALLEAVAEVEAVTHRLTIRTSQPALIRSLQGRPRWRVANVHKVGQVQKSLSRRMGTVKAIGSFGRAVVSFEWRPLV